MKIIKIDTPKGQFYIPLEYIAKERADYYFIEANEPMEHSVNVNFIMKDDYEGIDWLINNMNYSDIEHLVVKLNDNVNVTDEDFWTESDGFVIEDIEENIIPTKCPACSEPLKIIENAKSGSIGLYCTYDLCIGSAVKRLQKGIDVLEIKGIGGATCEKLFEAGIKTIEDFFDRTKFNRMKLIESGHFKTGRSLDIIVDAIDNTTSLELKRIVNSFNFTDVGRSVSEQIARSLADLPTDFGGLNKEAVAKMVNLESKERLRLDSFINVLNERHIDIVNPKELSSDVIKIEMTGKTEPYFKSKKEFLIAIEPYGYVHHKLNKECDVLVTNDLESTTGKMAKAIKLGKETKTYKQILEDLGLI